MERFNNSPKTSTAHMSGVLRWKLIFLAALGGALEFYDFVIFVFLADIIGILFFPPGLPSWLLTVQTFGIFAAGYIFRPLGGVVLAHFGDLLGRKRAFAFSILLMAGSTLAVAFLPVYQTIGIAAPLLLVVMRVLQGVAIGGEVPGAWTFVTEHVAPKHIGLACGLVCMGLCLGILLGSVIATVVTLLISPAALLSYGWRIPFLIGGIFGLLAVHLRRMLHETPVFVALQSRRMLVPGLPLRVILRKYALGIVTSILCTWVLSAVVVMLTLMVPTILQGVYHFSRHEALIATSISTVSLGVGVVLAGIVLDRFAAPRFFVVAGIVLAIGVSVFYGLIHQGTTHLYLLSVIVGLSGAVVTGVPFVMVSCFPAAVRFTGVSFSYNISYAFFGGLTPVGLAAFLALSSISHIYYLLFISGLSVFLGIYLWLFPKVTQHR